MAFISYFLCSHIGQFISELISFPYHCVKYSQWHSPHTNHLYSPGTQDSTWYVFDRYISITYTQTTLTVPACSNCTFIACAVYIVCWVFCCCVSTHFFCQPGLLRFCHMTHMIQLDLSYLLRKHLSRCWRNSLLENAHANSHMFWLRCDIHNFCYSLVGQNQSWGLSQPRGPKKAESWECLVSHSDEHLKSYRPHAHSSTVANP